MNNNRAHNKTLVRMQTTLRFVCPIDGIEQLTGLDFFAVLEDGVEDRIESRINPGHWGLSSAATN